MSVQKKLVEIQSKLKAPKSQYNSFGKYNYRSCEDILEGVKPLLTLTLCTLTLADDVVQVGDRIYIKATVILTDCESGESVSSTALAREAETKKGMDESQITGTASSYARKYALNGLFCIDDTKDADTDSYAQQNSKNGRSYTQKATPAPQVSTACECENCKRPFAEFEYKGKKFTATDAYQIAIKKYGKALCKECGTKLNGGTN